MSGITGYVRKLKLKVAKKLPIYRSNKFSLRNRVNRKLTEKYNWFRSKKVESDLENNSDNGQKKLKSDRKSGHRWGHYSKKKEPIESLENLVPKSLPPLAVLFVQYSENSELASRIRDVIQKLKVYTGINLKVVERVGEKLEDCLHKSNPWGESDCGRIDCFTCMSTVSSDEPKFKSCKQRCVIYETWCQTCLEAKCSNEKGESNTVKKSKNDSKSFYSSVAGDEGEATIIVKGGDVASVQKSKKDSKSYYSDKSKKDSKSYYSIVVGDEGKPTLKVTGDGDTSCIDVGGKLDDDTKIEEVTASKGQIEPGNKFAPITNEKSMVKNSKKRSLDKKLNGPFFHYIGETSRSAYERGQEHLKDLEFKRPKSHYLRHAVEFHSDVPPESLKFKMKVLSSHRTSFERQIREAVLIDYYSGPMLMNSKLEYTRCSLPKMSINMGNKQKEEDPMISKEKSTIEKKNENKNVV